MKGKNNGSTKYHVERLGHSAHAAASDAAGTTAIRSGTIAVSNADLSL